ncbi:MAG TPA: MBL fold metallo-hydrolase [Firmicutes bacterium]|nr:MBL fold metallo-hydrolase [Bacillota bacterium]
MFIKRVTRGQLLILLVVLAVNVCAVSAQMRVHFLDVGQAESILLQTDEYTLLIDAGDRDRNDVVPQLKAMGVEKLDLLILTHPHADHMGQAVAVLESFEVAEVWFSGSEHNTILYERLLDAILASPAAYNEPRRGQVYPLGDLTLHVLNPLQVRTGGKADLHDECLVIRAVYKDVAFLFTGDVERKTENKLLHSGLALQAHILNLGHHGSRTSSSLAFLETVAPQAAIYSAGRRNVYGHPHQEVLDRLKILGIPAFGTRRHGTITVITDGTDFEIISSVGSDRELAKSLQ